MEQLFFEGVKMLFIGAHPDDIELACLGTILKSQKVYNSVVSSLVCSTGLNRASEDRTMEQERVCSSYGARNLIWGTFEDGNIQANLELVSFIERHVNQIKPNIVFSHTYKDTHQDHIAVSRATIAALRNKDINLLFYSSSLPSPIDDFHFVPNVYVDIHSEVEEKLEILSMFTSQKGKIFFDKEYLLDRMKMVSVDSTIKYYEYFNIVKMFC